MYKRIEALSLQLFFNEVIKMDDQQKIVDLLTEIRDLQRIHLESYQAFRQQSIEEIQRGREATANYRKTVRRDVFLSVFVLILSLIIWAISPLIINW